MAVVVVAVFFALFKVLKTLSPLFNSALQKFSPAQKDGYTTDTGLDSSINKIQRSFFMFTHLLVLCLVMGDYFIWSESAPTGSSVLCRSARITTIVFYKPFIFSTLYCLNCLVDTKGWMLWHNPLTDSIVAVLMGLLFAWVGFSLVFSLPLLGCFFFFTLMFTIAPLAYFITVKDALINYSTPPPTQDELWSGSREELTEEERSKAAAAATVFKRLCFYSAAACLVFGVFLYPFYEGEGYAHVVERVGERVLPSIRLWSPEFRLSFSWPHVSFPSQIGLGCSIGAL
jgi:hypothetical protein